MEASLVHPLECQFYSARDVCWQMGYMWQKIITVQGWLKQDWTMGCSHCATVVQHWYTWLKLNNLEQHEQHNIQSSFNQLWTGWYFCRADWNKSWIWLDWTQCNAINWQMHGFINPMCKTLTFIPQFNLFFNKHKIKG